MKRKKTKAFKDVTADVVISDGNSTTYIETKTFGGGKLSRSEVVGVRLDPRLRYLADLVARKQRRTLSSFIEWAIEDVLAREKLKGSSTALESSSALWDVDECDRFVKLALFDESLLTHPEQIRWKFIREQGDPGIRAKDEKKIDWKQLRKIWPQAVAAGSKETGGS